LEDGFGVFGWRGVPEFQVEVLVFFLDKLHQSIHVVEVIGGVLISVVTAHRYHDVRFLVLLRHLLDLLDENVGLIRGVVVKGFLVVDEGVVVLVVFGDDVNIHSWEVAHWVDQDAGEDVKLVAGVLSVWSPNEVQLLVCLIFATEMHFEVLIDSRKVLSFETKL